MFLFSLYKQSETELYHMVVLILRNLYTIFQCGCLNIHSHQGCTGFSFFLILTNTCCYLLITAILTGLRWWWYLIVHLICTPVIISDVGHVFTHLFVICIFWKICLLYCSIHLSWTLFIYSFICLYFIISFDVQKPLLDEIPPAFFFHFFCFHW